MPSTPAPDVSVYVLKEFAFSRDGIRVEPAPEHSTIDLPAHLFDGLNRAGYVRREVIGDGHIDLAPSAPVVAKAPPEEVTFIPAEKVDVSIEANVAIVSPPTLSDMIQKATGGIARLMGVSNPAPSPASATAPLDPEETAALLDGSWESWRFFKKKSVAAKISDKPVKEGADVNAAILGYIAKLRA